MNDGHHPVPMGCDLLSHHRKLKEHKMNSTLGDAAVRRVAIGTVPKQGASAKSRAASTCPPRRWRTASGSKRTQENVMTWNPMPNGVREKPPPCVERASQARQDRRPHGGGHQGSSQEGLVTCRAGASGRRGSHKQHGLQGEVMKKHNHKLNSWGCGGPTHRYRLYQTGCKCQEECCLVEDTDGRGRTASGSKPNEKENR